VTRSERPDEWDRADVLMVASRLMTGREDPHIVLPVADHILMWLAGGEVPGTLGSRKAALMQQYQNIRSRDGGGVMKYADDPDGFLKAVAQLVPFLAGTAA
jgi:hypothetical protein